MDAIVTCLVELHDSRLLTASALVCLIGVYATFSLTRHANRSEGGTRRVWAVVAITTAGSTAWATHMIALLAYRPGMPSAFDPVMTAVSFLLVLIGIMLSIRLMMGWRTRMRRCASGLVLGVSIAALHYIGQASYRVTGTISWDVGLAATTVAGGLILFSVAMIALGERKRWVRRLAAPVLLGGISTLHVGGMTAMTMTYNPWIDLPARSVATEIISPIVAGVCMGLIVLAILGLRFTLRAQAQFRRDQARLNELANLALEGLVVCKGETITSANDSLVRLIGFSREQLVGRSIRSLVPAIAPEEMTKRDEYDAELTTWDGKLVPVRVLRDEVSIGPKRQTVFAVRDQRERLKVEATVRRLAYTDQLTGLLNRLRFTEILEAQMVSARSDGSDFAVLVIDLDRFKWVNDILGHPTGDELLCRVAERLRRCTAEGDVIARLGGDEFTILVFGGVDRASDVAEQIVRVCREPFLVNGQNVEIGASVGIAIQDEAEAESVSYSANLALREAKKLGRGRFCLFKPRMMSEAFAQHAFERDLRRALDRNEFEVHYQPQVNVCGGAVESAEALVRWNHPVRGMVSPATFIPLAEEIGLIGAIGMKVLRIACTEAFRWPGSPTLAVNLSPLQLGDPDLIVSISRVLRETGYPPERLELEVTESALLQDNSRTYENLHGLRELGIGISLDDFGTGYSSLSHLRRFPFDKIKIDRSFVRLVPEDADSVAIVQAIVTLAKKLRMSVTIEGVETLEQKAFAIREGCDQIQGYLISKPIPSAEMRQFRYLVHPVGYPA